MPGDENDIEEGTVVRIHSLKSAVGQKMNNNRALVIKYHPDTARYEVRLEFEEDCDATKALKKSNLKPLKTSTMRNALLVSEIFTSRIPCEVYVRLCTCFL